jgi:catechol 2,3-dioxygenase-like lactoylglutathione lyase family enzyme
MPAARLFHHVGIPTRDQKNNEILLEGGRVFITDPEVSPYRIEWLRFLPDSPLPAELKNLPHIAFLVEDVRTAMAGKKVVIEPFAPMPGVEVGFVLDDGALIEFMHKAS